MQGKNHHWLVAFVHKEPILHRTALQGREGANQRVAYLGVIGLWQAINALNLVLEFQASATATLDNVGKHFALLVVVVKPGQLRTDLKSELGRHEVPLLVDGLKAL